MNGWIVPAIGVFAALIAYLQWITAHRKIVLELFDKGLEGIPRNTDSAHTKHAPWGSYAGGFFRISPCR